MLFLCNFANTNGKFSLIVGDTSLKAKRIAKVGMGPLIERTCETNSRLYADEVSLP